MDVFAHCIIGFDIGGASIDDLSVCRLFNQTIGDNSPPTWIPGRHILLEYDPFCSDT